MRNNQKKKFLFYRRKAYMTLLETLIAVSLLSVLLTFVFGFFRELSQLSYLTEQNQKESFRMRYLESRLSFIFERLVNENLKGQRFFFYTSPPNHDFSELTSLIFSFDNEVRLDPTFSGDVLARLYVDLNHRLCLAMWPLHIFPPHEHLHEEILFENVVNVEFDLYAAPEPQRRSTDIHTPKVIDPDEKTPERNQWHNNDWPITYEEMPSILKIKLEIVVNPSDLKDADRGARIKTTPLNLHFVLPSSNHPVQYPSD